MTMKIRKCQNFVDDFLRESTILKFNQVFFRNLYETEINSAETTCLTRKFPRHSNEAYLELEDESKRLVDEEANVGLS